MARNIFIGGPVPDGHTIDGSPSDEPARRPTSFTDDMRSAAIKAGFQRDLKRDENMPNDAERRQAAEYLEDVVDSVDSYAAQQGRVMKEDWEDASYTGGKPGLAVTERISMLRDGYAALDKMSVDDHKDLRREIRDSKSQTVAKNQRVQQGEKIAELALDRFKLSSPDLQHVPTAVVENYARKVTREGGYRSEHFIREDGAPDLETIDELVLGVGAAMREDGYSRVDDDSGSDLMSQIRQQQKKDGFL